MRLPFALCAWALLLAAPGVHGLRPRDPAKLLVGPQSMIWRSDRDTATRVSPYADCHTGQLNIVEGSKVAIPTTWSQSTDPVESIIMHYFRVANSTAVYRVGRLEGGHVDKQIKSQPPSATPTWSNFQLLRQSTQLVEYIKDMFASLSIEKYNIGSFILDVLVEALVNLRNAMRLLFGIAAYTLYVTYICQYVLPLFAGLYFVRRCERSKYVGSMDCLADHSMGSRLRISLHHRFIVCSSNLIC